MQPPATTIQLQELFSTASQNLTHPLLSTLQPSCPPTNVSFFQKGKNIPIHHIFQKCIPTCTLSPNLTQNTQNADDRGAKAGTQKLCLQIPVTLQIPPPPCTELWIYSIPLIQKEFCPSWTSPQYCLMLKEKYACLVG